MSTEQNLKDENKALHIADVNKRSFIVSYLGNDDKGLIVKGVEVIAPNINKAIEIVLEVNNAKEIYGATEN